jgi:hypothetical protein
LATKEVFGQLCKRVCQAQGWNLLPSGIEVTWGDGRHQIVSLEFFDYREHELVRLFTTIGDSTQLSATRLNIVLRLNAELAHGALAVKDDNLVMTDTLLLKDADPDEIEAAVSYLAETADYYEKQLFGTDVH